MAIFDGEFVDDSKVNPKEHRFVGTFRTPQPPKSNGTWAVLLCNCGQNLWTVDVVFDHWNQGHLDEPQYLTITEEGI